MSERDGFLATTVMQMGKPLQFNMDYAHGDTNIGVIRRYYCMSCMEALLSLFPMKGSPQPNDV